MGKKEPAGMFPEKTEFGSDGGDTCLGSDSSEGGDSDADMPDDPGAVPDTALPAGMDGSVRKVRKTEAEVRWPVSCCFVLACTIVG